MQYNSFINHFLNIKNEFNTVNCMSYSYVIMYQNFVLWVSYSSNPFSSLGCKYSTKKNNNNDTDNFKLQWNPVNLVTNGPKKPDCIINK